MNAERVGYPLKKINRRVFRLPFKTAHIGAIYPSLASQFFLRDTLLYANPTHIPGH
ncbi:hypothetical protein BEL01nite_67550 [Bradyrhizobium elkanii]|nr:hypothetical protein BEL01nite_67550 [Bradyrhizobium elkanii]